MLLINALKKKVWNGQCRQVTNWHLNGDLEGNFLAENDSYKGVVNLAGYKVDYIFDEALKDNEFYLKGVNKK